MAGKLSKTELKKITRTLTDNEAVMVDKQRKFGELEITGKLRELYIRSEEGMYTIDNALFAIDSKMQKIAEMYLHLIRNQVQIKGGPKEIWRHLEGYPNVKMTRAELESEILTTRLMMEKEVSGIRANLSNLVTYVEQLGVDGKVMLTEKQLLDKISAVETYLSKFGVKLL